jgi:hypothetical protein
MSSTFERPTQQGLFDLEPGSDEGPFRPRASAAGPFVMSRPEPEEPEPPRGAGPDGLADMEPAPLATRLFAALTDLVAHLGALAVGLGGIRLLGVVPSPADLPALLCLLAVFSLFFTVIPLAFWGRTPGMAAAGIETRSLGGELLTFGQAARRWLASLLVVASAGLLALIALSGTSLPERWSGSRTFLV